MTLAYPQLDSEIVRLEPLQSVHAAELWQAIGADERVWRYLPGTFASEADLERFVADAHGAHAQGTDLPFCIRERQSGRAVGSTRLMDYRPAHGGVEIGWTFLAPDVWASAVNPACKLLLFGHAFDTLGLTRVQLKTDARNLHSQRAIEKLGAAREGVLRKVVKLPDGFMRDSVYFSVLAEEWPGVREKLELRLRGR